MRHAVLAIGFAMVLPLAACESTPTGPAPSADHGLAPAAALVANDRFPFTDTELVCTEVVDFTGQFHIKVTATTSASGNQHFTFHINARGTGVGQTSGATYQWNDSIVEVVNDAVAPFILTAVRNLTLTGQGAADNLSLRQRFHITVNANGETTVLHDSLEITCR